MLAACALAWPVTAHAQEEAPMVTDRPDFTESASVVTPGRFQFEVGHTFTKSGSEERHSFGELLARVGILSWLEGRLGLNSFSQVRSPSSDSSGLEDLTLSFKALLYRKPGGSSAAVPQVALLFGADLPTGEGSFGENEWQPGLRLALDFDLSDRFNVGSNLGYAFLHSDGERFHQALVSLVTGYAISGPLTAFIEGYGFFPENRGGGSNYYVDGGLAWQIKPSLQLDWRIGLGLQDPDPNWLTGLGVSFRL
jgi:hypothetical protein